MSKMYENWLAMSDMENEVCNKFSKAHLITNFAGQKSIYVCLDVKSKNILYLTNGRLISIEKIKICLKQIF